MSLEALTAEFFEDSKTNSVKSPGNVNHTSGSQTQKGITIMTTSDPKSSFAGHLARAYPHQVRNSSEGPIQFSIDDQVSDDKGHLFCNINVMVPNPEVGKFNLTMDNVPFDEDVETTVINLGGVWAEGHPGKSFSIPLAVNSAGKIRILARKIRSVTGRGKMYLNSNWKWMVPRTVESLQYFASVISGFYRETRG